MDPSRQGKLLELLKRAELQLRALGNSSIWSSYESGPAMADFLASARSRIEAGSIDAATLRELWGIFAPTCDWDDVIGDVELGDEIFDLLEQATKGAG